VASIGAARCWVNGTAGTGKSTLAALFCEAACRAGERATYFAFEESEAQIVRNMSSVGIDLKRWVDAGLLQFRCFRPSLLGLEAHLFSMQKAVGDFDPSVVVIDPVSDLLRIGSGADVSAMLARQIDFLKAKGVTAFFTSLISSRSRRRRPTSRSSRSSTRGSSCGRRRATASTTACCTCSSRAAWPTRTRSGSSSSPVRASSSPTSTSVPKGC
jgi:hypothetical protein